MSNQLFTHYIITRFNLKNKSWRFSKNGSEVLTNKWLADRFDLFENFCLPSLQSQENKNFIWLIFFSEDTPLVYKNKILEYEKSIPQLKPVFIPDMESFLPSILSELKTCKTPYIISSRLDNDDCLSRFYVDEVQNCFNKQPFMILDFPDGYTLEVRGPSSQSVSQSVSLVRLGKRKQVYNPFLSLIEQNNSPKSIWHEKMHSGWKREKIYCELEEKEFGCLLFIPTIK